MDDAIAPSSAGGIAVQILPRVKRLSGDGGHLRIGPRLSAEIEGGGGQPAAGLFGLAFVFRWVTFDSTRRNF
jgi:hypothetical protein